MNYLEYSIKDEVSVFVETSDDLSNLGLEQASIKTNVLVKKAKNSFEDALERIRPASDAIIKKLRRLVDPPEEIEVQFGLKITAEVGAVITSTGTEAHYSVTLKWKRK